MNKAAKEYNFEYLPQSYNSTFGCSCYKVQDVEGFIKEDAYIFPEPGTGEYWVSIYQVDEQALIEYRKLQEVIETAKQPIKVRIRQGYKSRNGKDWSNLAGELWGSTTLVMVNFGNKRQFCEIQHRDLVLA